MLVVSVTLGRPRPLVFASAGHFTVPTMAKFISYREEPGANAYPGLRDIRALQR
jgi:hypothetical protein